MLPKHMPALDGLRGIAILLVILTHAASGWDAALSIYHVTDPVMGAVDLPFWIKTIAAEASHGVQLFFVVSAFTLTCRAARHDDDLRGYALRRIARVGPGYWVGALAYTALGGLAPRVFAPDGIGATDLITAILFGSAWQGGAALAVVPGGWTVCCEVAFYVALPFLLRLIDGRIGRALALAGIATVAANLWARPLMLNGGWTFAAYVNPLVQAPAFLYGICAALIAMQYKLPSAPNMAVALLIFAILLWPFSPVGDFHFLHHLSFAVLMAVVVALAAVAPPRILVGRLIRRIGEVSYSMYLVHFAILAPSLGLAARLAPAHDGITIAIHFAITLAVSFALSNVTYRFIEQPWIRWASRVSARWEVSEHMPLRERPNHS